MKHGFNILAAPIQSSLREVVTPSTVLDSTTLHRIVRSLQYSPSLGPPPPGFFVLHRSALPDVG